MARRIFIHLLLGLCLGTAPSPAQADRSPPLSDSVPVILYSLDPARTYPVFVADEAAITSAGVIDENLFSESGVEVLENILASTGEDCFELGPVHSSFLGAPDLSSLEGATESAQLIVRGRVTAASPGFGGTDRAGQLLRVTPTEILEGSSPADHFYYFYPVAELDLDGRAVCKKDPRYPPPPKPGDEVVLFVPYYDDPSDPYIETMGPGVIVISRRHGVQLPSHPGWKSAEARPEELLEQIRKGARR